MLRGERSQTYRPEHHNFSEHFVFEPHQEPGLSPSILAELDAKGFRWIHALVGEIDAGIETYGACELVLDCACPGESVPFRRGDCNDDWTADLSDALCILNWLFLGTATPGCMSATNTNGDAGTDLTDAVYLLGFLFLGGPAPADPFDDVRARHAAIRSGGRLRIFASCGGSGAEE